MTSAWEIIERVNRENGVEPEPWPNRAQREDETVEVHSVKKNEDGTISWAPNRKVIAALATGVVAVFAAYMSENHGYELNADGMSAVTGALMVLAAYFIPEKK